MEKVFYDKNVESQASGGDSGEKNVEHLCDQKEKLGGVNFKGNKRRNSPVETHEKAKWWVEEIY